ncbi:MAG: DUF2442 domain-containing protein [Thermoanaerobaculia bacterium]
MLIPVEIKALPNYRLWLRYADGVTGEVDLSHLAGDGVFALWNDPGEFEKVHVGPLGNIAWTDEVDICPDALYLEITGKSPEDVFPGLFRGHE